MKSYYLREIFPRIKRFGDSLEKRALYMGKIWLQIPKNPGFSNTSYIFKSDQSLLKTINGETEIGRWEIPHPDRLLIVERNSSSMYDLKRSFLNKDAFILQKENSEEYLLLLNESKFYKVKNKLIQDSETVLKWIGDSVYSGSRQFEEMPLEKLRPQKESNSNKIKSFTLSEVQKQLIVLLVCVVVLAIFLYIVVG